MDDGGERWACESAGESDNSDEDAVSERERKLMDEVHMHMRMRMHMHMHMHTRGSNSACIPAMHMDITE